MGVKAHGSAKRHKKRDGLATRDAAVCLRQPLGHVGENGADAVKNVAAGCRPNIGAATVPRMVEAHGSAKRHKKIDGLATRDAAVCLWQPLGHVGENGADAVKNVAAECRPNIGDATVPRMVEAHGSAKRHK